MESNLSAQATLFDRAEIHKSCKSFETLINTLNDYCEAAESVIALQKKLAKALKETAGLKVTGPIAANALNASASIFDVMSDIDTKFSKIVDKECDSINSDTKKWFKKLAKEEKAHDERISAANDRIKQGGQIYEKKVKKNARDANEEHARYINLISTLGPEISQEKYNHTLLVTQKHSSATYNVAACLSRIADTEWVRSCEQVRRFSPVAAQLGEWRTYCEGGWTGTIPQDLPDINAPPQDESIAPEAAHLQRPAMFAMESSDRRESMEASAPDGTKGILEIPASEQSLPSISASSSGHAPNTARALEPPRPAFASNENWLDTVGSVASLSSFPSPPSYVPAATPTKEPETPERPQARSLPTQPPQASSSTTSSHLPPLSESPLPWVAEKQTNNVEDSRLARVDVHMPPVMPIASLHSQERSPTTAGHGDSMERGNRLLNTVASPSSPTQTNVRSSPARTRQQSMDAFKASNTSGQDSLDNRRDDYFAEDFGMSRSSGAVEPVPKEAELPRALERNASTVSTGSVVAAMRNRYTSPIEPSPPPPRKVPRLPLSVNDLASRYQPADSPASPRRRTVSPVDERQHRTLDVLSPRPSPYTQDRSPDGNYVRFPSPSTEANMEELTRLRRLREQAEQEQRLKEQSLQARELQIELRTRELEQDRAHFLKSRTDGYSNSSGDDPFRPSTNASDPRRYSQPDGLHLAQAISSGRHSYSTTHLVPPSSSSSTHLPYSRPQTQPPSSAEPRRPSTSDHAEFCGCATCSVSKYRMRSTPSPHDLRPPEPPITLRPEKPKGWIRRLSMPVGNAFSLDSKKSNSSLRTPAGEDGRMRRSFEQGGISNRSMTNIGRR